MRAVAFCFVLVICAACGRDPNVNSKIRSQASSRRLLHTVIFWFRPETSQTRITELRAIYAQRLATIPGVLQVYVGQPVPTERPEADDSFSLYTMMRFSSRQAHDAWQKHTMHLQLKQRFRDVIERIVVYDALE